MKMGRWFPLNGNNYEQRGSFVVENVYFGGADIYFDKF